MNNLYNNPDTYFHFDHFEERTNSDPLALFKMIQLGDVNCTPNYIGPLHLQMCYEISYVVSARAILCAIILNILCKRAIYA